MTRFVRMLVSAAFLLSWSAEARQGPASGGVGAPEIIIRIDRPPYDERGSPLM